MTGDRRRPGYDDTSGETLVVDHSSCHGLGEDSVFVTEDFEPDPIEMAILGATAEGSRCGFVPGYSVLGRLGQGGMSVVYQAIQEKLQRVVALKVLTPKRCVDPEAVTLFEREAKAVARLNHPNIVTAFDYGEAEGRFFLALEYIEGMNCLELIEKEGRIEEQRALRIIRGAILGLSHALGHGVIHRDVKPANLMFSAEGPQDARHVDAAGLVKVTDLGLALMEETASGQDSRDDQRVIAGTPSYMAPEQARGEDVDFRTDVYALGATLFHMITGTKPFDGDTIIEIILKKVHERLPHPHDLEPSLSAPVCWLLDRMMARSPEYRYQSYEALLHDVDTLLRGEAPCILPMDPAESSFLHPTVAPHLLRRRSDYFEIVEEAAIERRKRRLGPIAVALISGAAFAAGLVLGVCL